MITFRVWDKDKEMYLYQTLNDLLNGVGDDCPDWETSMFAHAVLQDDAVPELVQDVIGCMNDKNEILADAKVTK